MKRKTKDFLTVFSSIILTAAIAYTVILTLRYAQIHGGVLLIPAQTAVDHLLRVFPIFFVLFVILTVLVADRSDRLQKESTLPQVERGGMHVYSFDIPQRENPNEPQEEKNPPTPSTSDTDPYASSLSSDELDFFEQNDREKEDQAQQERMEPVKVREPVEKSESVEEIFDDKYEPARPPVTQKAAPQTQPPKEQISRKESSPSFSYPPVGTMDERSKTHSSTAEEIDQEDDFYKRLAQEVDFSNEKRYEVSLLLINLEPEKFSSDFLVFKEAVSSFFQETSFIFEYTHEHSFAVILPFFSFSDAQKELVRFYTSLKEELAQRSTIFRAGFSSKFNRIIDSETLLYETEVAFKKALEDTGFCILGFEPDVNKYEQYYWSS